MNRRHVLAAAGAAWALSAEHGARAAAPQVAGPLDPGKPEHLHLIHRKLNFTYDDRLVFWFIRAVRYGLMEGHFTPFWAMHVGMVFAIEDLGPHRYRSRGLIKIFYTDLATGRLLETFDNPYTSQRRTVEQPKLGRPVRVHGLTGVESDGPALAGPDKGPVSRNAAIGPAWIIGDDVWCNGDLVVRAEPPNDLGQLIQVNDWSTYHGSARAIADPDVPSAAATHTFNDINTFNHPWIGMTGVPAWSVSRGFGRKGHDVDAMPAEWRRFMADAHPEVMKDIKGAMAG
ncbi:MAG: hypothetical protein SFV21_15685 [Rhodospirillaceae bacterium]|nr:hypothetical protein [Rhodospirillaceae bacterium]